MNAFALRRLTLSVPSGLVTTVTGPRLCTNRGCEYPATATVLVSAQRMDKCFTHEREYADRFGPADIYPLS